MRREKIIIEKDFVRITLVGGNVWLTQQEIARLLGCFVAKVNANIRAILKTKVLDERGVCQHHYYENGNSVDLYNIEMIIALSFHIKTKNSDIFRQWIINKVITDRIRNPVLKNENWNKYGFSLN